MIPYRVRQVLWALTARPLTESDLNLIDQILSPAEKSLFEQYSTNDQNHAIRVVKLVLAEPQSCLELQKAALLHDVGKVKVGRLSVIDRSVAVALKRLLPKRSKKWGIINLNQASRFQIPSIVRAQHADWGADMVKAAGGDELTVCLIRRHQDKIVPNQDSVEDRLLILLQAADNVS